MTGWVRYKFLINTIMTEREKINAKILETRRADYRNHNKRTKLEIRLANLKEDGVYFKTEKIHDKRKVISGTVKKRCWTEAFKDQDSEKIIYVDRSEIVKVNNKPCDKFGRLIKLIEIDF